MWTGKELIKIGLKPSRYFSRILKKANDENLSAEQVIVFADSLIPKTISPLKEAIPFYRNIEPENELEVNNVNKVYAIMDGLMRLPTVVTGAVMPDACPTGANQIPVGGVIVTKNAIHPSFHSADICCSVMLSDLGNTSPKDVLDAAHSITHFGPGGREEFSDLPEELTARILNNPFTVNFTDKAKSHMGTQGDGNHFLFVGKSETSNKTFLVTHHGSRGFGAMLYRKGMEVAEMFRKEISPESDPKNPWIPADSIEGKLYWEALQILRDWTKLNHQTIHNATSQKVGVTVNENFWNEHNFVFKEGDLFYHAKGATPIKDEFLPDNYHGLRLIPLSMSQPILIVRGNTTENNLGFAPHGAGRNMSRKDHKKSKEGISYCDILDQETAGLDIRFFSGRTDISELPSAYKNADSIKKQIEKFKLCSIVDSITPYGCIMAGN